MKNMTWKEPQTDAGPLITQSRHDEAALCPWKTDVYKVKETTGSLISLREMDEAGIYKWKYCF